MFEYQPLDRSQRASRLVVLQPGNVEDAIECSIIEPLLLESFESILKYEALSYVWGDSEPTQDILIEGSPFPFGKNLYSALFHLRHEHKVRLLWIDAICINKNDVDERNWQVSHMGLIYRSAERVLVWLGESTFNYRVIFSLLLVLEHVQEGRGDQVRPRLRNLAAVVFGDLEHRPDFTDCEGYELIWKEFDNLVQGPFFQRAWVVQEIVLAQEVMVHCGFHYATWDLLVEGYIRASELQRLSQGISDALIASRNFMQIATLRRGLQNPTAEDYQDMTLMRLAARFGRLLATNPRDKLYACLGISRHLIETGKLLDHGFYPDYDKSVFQVYKDFALFCIQKYQSLDDVFAAGQALDPERDYHFRLGEWSSWVPDWQVRGTQTWGFKSLAGPEYHLSRDFRASGDTIVSAQELPGVENILSVQGLIFDTVTDVTIDWFEELPKDISSSDMKWLKWHAMYEECPPENDPYGSKDAREEAYWRTLVADSNGKEKAPGEFGDCFRIWRYFKSNYEAKPGCITKSWIPEFDMSELPEGITDVYDDFIEQMTMIVRGRKLFKTQRGYIGIGSWAVKSGWSVCILQGGSYPMLAQTEGFLAMKISQDLEHSKQSEITEGSEGLEMCSMEGLSLQEKIKGADAGGREVNDVLEEIVKVETRKNQEPETIKVPCFSFMGTAPCYIHGVMDGEALEIAEAEGLKAGQVLFA